MSAAPSRSRRGARRDALTSSLYHALKGLSLLGLMSCAHDYELTRAPSAPASVGAVAFEVMSHEASLAFRVSDAKVSRLNTEQSALVSAVDRWLTWPTLHTMADELYSWGFLYDEPLSAALLKASSQRLAQLASQQAPLALLSGEQLRARLSALSPYAPSPLTLLMSPGFGAPLSELLRWLSLHDGQPSPHLEQPERSVSLYALLIYLEELLRRGEPLPASVAEIFELLFEPLPAHRAPTPQINHEPLASFAVPFEELKQTTLAPVRDWEQRSSYQEGVSQDLRLSVAYALSAGFGEWWSSGALGAAQDLLEALLSTPALVPAPLLGGEAMAYPSAQSLTPLAEAALDLVDHAVTPTLLGYLGAKLPQDEGTIAALLDDLQSLSSSLDEQRPYQAAALELRAHGFVPDMIEALSELLLFKAEVRPRGRYGATDSQRAPLLSRREASLLLITELIMALDDPALQSLPEVTALMMRSQAPEGGALPPLGGRYDQCALDCERAHQGQPAPHLACLETCPSGDLLRQHPPEALQTQSAFERSIALIRDFAGHPYQMRVTHFRSDLFDALSDAQAIDPALLPPLLEIDDVAATFLSSVIGELSLGELVSPEAIGNPQVELMLDGFDMLCEEGSLSNDLLNNLLPRLTEVTEELLNERCRSLINARSLGEDEWAKRSQIAVLVSMLSLLTDVPMSERPSTGELIRFFNLEAPAVYLGVLDLELSQLVCAEGYPLYEHHGYALYAGEAAGLYQALSPLIRLAHRYDKLPALVRLLGTLYTHYGHSTRPFYRADRSLSETAGTGLVYLEPTLELLLSAPQTPQLMSGLTALIKDRGLSEIGLKRREPVTDGWRVAQWPQTRLTLGISDEAWEELRRRSAELGDPVWRETGTSSTRGALLLGALLERAFTPSAGPSGQGRLNALWRALTYLLDELDRDPSRSDQAEQALELLWELATGLFERRPGAVRPELMSQRALYVSAAALSWLGDQGARWEALGQSRLHEEAHRIDELVAHPALYHALNLATDLRQSPAGRSLDALLAPLWADPLSLTAALYQLGALMMTPDLHQLGPALAPLIDAQASPALPQALMDLAGRVTQASAWGGWEELLRGGLLPAPPTGAEPLGHPPRAPLFELVSLLVELTRQDPQQATPWSLEDWRTSIVELTRWLSDEQTGLIKGLSIISDRARD